MPPPLTLPPLAKVLRVLRVLKVLKVLRVCGGRNDNFAKNFFCAIRQHFFRGARWLNLSKLLPMLFR